MSDCIAMILSRLHLFELEDQPWFPDLIRDLATDYLCFIQATFHLHRPIVPLLGEALRTSGHRQVVDCCSGGGGPVLEVQKALAAAGLETHVILTDRFPNLAAFERTAETSAGRVSFSGRNVEGPFRFHRVCGLRA